ncbi:hypothetical protein [Wielerella bovis]|uniref:hypothetical protein n=1 Tax=Wielerella bovis TaxID=2917790 RepID=UPI002018EC12|nr:hypothetical protein [Wielerella bovis]ULJ66199.1 hypothetical protein MIS31_07935 [Wielerella bovis]
MSKVNQLEKLDKLYQDGQLSKSEYKKMRAEIITGNVKRTRPKSGCLGILIKWSVSLFVMIVLFNMLISHNKQSQSDTSRSLLSQIAENDEAPKPKQSVEEILDEISRENGTGCYTSPKILQEVRDEINVYGKAKGWNSERTITKKLGYVHFENLLEDTVMAKGVGMPVPNFLQKREEFPDVNKGNRKQKAKCDFLDKTIPYQADDVSTDVQAAETPINQDDLKPEKASNVDHLF